jgi:hypothetical protein
MKMLTIYVNIEAMYVLSEVGIQLFKKILNLRTQTPGFIFVCSEILHVSGRL